MNHSSACTWLVCSNLQALSNETRIEIDRLVWVGPLSVCASIAAVLLVRAAALKWIQPEPEFLPLTLAPAILDTAVLVTLAVFVFRRVLSGGAFPGPLLALLGARFFTLDGCAAFRLLAFRVLLISFLPDITVALSGASRWQYAVALALMHVAAWAVYVTMLTKLVKSGPTD
jgi:hypothetical protein